MANHLRFEVTSRFVPLRALGDEINEDFFVPAWPRARFGQLPFDHGIESGFGRAFSLGGR
jgi:hypothetical protein